MAKKTGIIKRTGRAIGGALQGKRTRFTSSVLGSVGINLAGGASATGVLLGRGENLVQKVGDAIMAIPRGIANTVDYYIHAPEYARQADAALQYVREHGQETINEMNRAGSLFNHGVAQAGRGIGYIRDAQDYLIPGGDKGFNIYEALGNLRSGLNALEASGESLRKGSDQLNETAGPAIDALQNIDWNPVLQALHNLADNVAPDEIGYTLGVAATAVTGAYALSQLVRGYWGRRGKPGWLARQIQKRGLKTWRNRYTEHPEEIAGKEGLEIFEDAVARNKGMLEKIASKAGYALTPRDSEE